VLLEYAFLLFLVGSGKYFQSFFLEGDIVERIKKRIKLIDDSVSSAVSCIK
jgi:hypothetical protein